MANADQIKALIESHADGDNARFCSVALQVAAQAAQEGQDGFAKELRDLVGQARVRGSGVDSVPGVSPIPLAQPRGELAGLMTVGYPDTHLATMVLDAQLAERLDRVLTEQRERVRLRSFGLAPLRKLLLLGPPGTGKTMTAAALAGDLGIPLFTIQLDALITRYLGKAAAKLHLIFEAVEKTRGVYLFDKFDGLGAQRASMNGVGETQCVLNSFLQFLEQDNSDSLVIGATHHAELLDHALFCRFDAVIDYELPTGKVAERVMRERLAVLDVSRIDWSEAARAAAGLSHAELTRASEQAAKNAILNRSGHVEHPALMSALEDRWSTERGHQGGRG